MSGVQYFDDRKILCSKVLRQLSEEKYFRDLTVLIIKNPYDVLYIIQSIVAFTVDILGKAFRMEFISVKWWLDNALVDMIFIWYLIYSPNRVCLKTCFQMIFFIILWFIKAYLFNFTFSVQRNGVDAFCDLDLIAFSLVTNFFASGMRCYPAYDWKHGSIL